MPKRTKRRAYYNEFEPYTAEWLRNLIRDGLISNGDVDERSILDVTAQDIKEYTQVHLFAGIGGWSYALRLAGWKDDASAWTGSCPCPPFSSVGKRQACPSCEEHAAVPHPYKTGIFVCSMCDRQWYADERHLWPEMLRLISECRPAVCFGEQVASSDGRLWLAGVRATLEALGYGVGCADLCAAGVGAPHIRQRLWWVGDTDNSVGYEISSISQRQGAEPSGGFWNDFDLVSCADGKQRRVESGIFPLVYGVPARVGKMRAYGNAICPQVATEFVKAYMETVK